VVAGSIVGAVPLVLAACSPSSGTAPRPPTGSVPALLTGTVYSCVGPPVTPGQYDKLPVFITVSRGGRTVAHQSGHGTMTYRFTVAPGSYVLAGQLDTPVHTVSVGPRQRANTDLIPDCA
jgi:hypothetical protein